MCFLLWVLVLENTWYTIHIFPKLQNCSYLCFANKYLYIKSNDTLWLHLLTFKTLWFVLGLPQRLNVNVHSIFISICFTYSIIMNIKRLINASSIKSKHRKMLFSTSTLYLFLIFFHYLSRKEMNIEYSKISHWYLSCHSLPLCSFAR